MNLNQNQNDFGFEERERDIHTKNWADAIIHSNLNRADLLI